MLTLTQNRQYVNECDLQTAASYGLGRKFKALKYLVFHYTAGRSYESSLERFKDPSSKVSAHFLVARDGRIAQMVSLNWPAWHAGESSYKPKGQLIADKGINFYSIGIELENFGPLTFVPKRGCFTWFGQQVDNDNVAEVDPTMEGAFGRRFWHSYTSDQIEVAGDLAALLVRELGIKDVLGHSDISPGRKQDPGPVFPLANIRSLVLSRS